MIRTFSGFSVALLVALVMGCEKVELPDATAERGGVTFDFKAISERRFAGVFDELRNLAKENRSGHLTATKRMEFTLPTTNGGVYRVSCRYRLAHVKQGRAAFGVSPGGYFSYVIPESANAWSVLSERAKVPCGKDKITLAFTLHGGGVTFDYKDLTILDETPTAPLETTWTQSDNLDGTYAVAEGQPCEMEVYWRKTVKENLFCGDFRARLELPAGIAFVGAAFADTNTVKTAANPDGSTVTTFAVARTSRSPLAAYVSYGGLSLVVKATRGPGEAGVGRLTFDYVGKAVPKFSQALKPVSFFVIPRIRAAATPVTYANGVMPSGPLEGLRDAAEEEIASFMGECGVTWLVGRAREKTYADWRKAGISRLTPGIWPCVDGFNVRGHKPVPESDRFVALDPSTGKPTQVTQGSVCPVTVYEQSEYFRTVTVPFIRDYVKGADGAWANWEPGSYKGKGCFCDRCCRKFADYVRERYETVKADWPKCVMKGGRWFDRVEKFRSLEHAKVVHTIDGIVRAATGGEKSFGFIPAIAWIEMSSWWRPRNYAAEVQAIDYADKLGWMCPWGPYAAWETDFPYVYQKRKPLCQFLAAKDIRATVDADYPAGSRPKLMGLPQGRQCSHWMTQPESIGLALDSYFFNAWESTVVYFFPQGYDARYWERFADATARAAKYEGFVLKGRRVDDAVTATPCGAYAKNVKYPSAYLPKEKNVPMLQAVAWEKDGRRIVAVFNFWEKGEAFFDLKVRGLKGEVAVVDEKGVLRAADRSRPLWSAEALASKGVRLMVPAARCCVFEFRPDGNWQEATAVQTDEALRRLYETRRESLENAAREDAETEGANGPIDVDYMPVI